jgi:hypothetical protein
VIQMVTEVLPRFVADGVLQRGGKPGSAPACSAVVNCARAPHRTGCGSSPSRSAPAGTSRRLGHWSAPRTCSPPMTAGVLAIEYLAGARLADHRYPLTPPSEPDLAGRYTLWPPAEVGTRSTGLRAKRRLRRPPAALPSPRDPRRRRCGGGDPPAGLSSWCSPRFRARRRPVHQRPGHVRRCRPAGLGVRRLPTARI